MHISHLLTPIKTFNTKDPDLRDHQVLQVPSLRHVGRTLYIKRLHRQDDAPLTLAERTMLSLAHVPADLVVCIEGPRRINFGPFVVCFDEALLRTRTRPPAARKSI